MRGKAITLEQEQLMVKLYKEGLPIKKIMQETGIKSEQTIYRLLDNNNIPRRPKKENTKVTFVASASSLQILSCQQDVSEYINKAILLASKELSQTV